MIIRLRPALAAANLLLGLALATPAAASDAPLYPRTTGSGENTEIDYGPGPRGNVVGGGRVHVSGSGEQAEFHHLDSDFVQRPPAGLVPVTVGSGENSSTAWVPAEATRGPALGLLLEAVTPHG